MGGIFCRPSKIKTDKNVSLNSLLKFIMITNNFFHCLRTWSHSLVSHNQTLLPLIFPKVPLSPSSFNQCHNSWPCQLYRPSSVSTWDYPLYWHIEVTFWRRKLIFRTGSSLTAALTCRDLPSLGCNASKMRKKGSLAPCNVSLIRKMSSVAVYNHSLAR